MKTVITTYNRQRLHQELNQAPDGYVVDIREPTRSLQANALFHSLCGDIADSGFKWMGKARSAKEWKVLLVSAHAIATGYGAEVVAGLEGELVNIREETSKMSIRRCNSLIEYTQAFCAMNGVKLPYVEDAA
jgi:hypothetical protein